VAGLFRETRGGSGAGRKASSTGSMIRYCNAISGRAMIRGGGSRGGAREGGESEERVNNTNASGTYSYGCFRGYDLEGVGAWVGG
jgi:hypothetical protein